MLCRVGHARYLALLDRARAAGVGWERRRMDWSGRGGRSPRALSLGDRADHSDRARGFAAGDVQFSTRGADRVPGPDQRAAPGHVVPAERQGQREAAVAVGCGREVAACCGARCDRAGQRERRAGWRTATRTNVPRTACW